SPALAQSHLADERDLRTLRDLGLPGDSRVTVWPLGTAFDPIRRYGLKVEGARGFSQLLATKPFGGWTRQLLGRQGTPRLHLTHRLGVDVGRLEPTVRKQIEHLANRYPAAAGRMASGAGSVLVHVLPRSLQSR